MKIIANNRIYSDELVGEYYKKEGVEFRHDGYKKYLAGSNSGAFNTDQRLLG